MVLRLFLFMFILLLPATATSQQPRAENAAAEVQSILAQDEITWADLARLAELTSPTLAAAQNAVNAQAARAQQAAAYPNPVLGLDLDEMSTRDPSNRKEKVTLVQPVILGGRRGAAVDAAQAAHESALKEIRNARREVLVGLRTLWVQQLYFREMEVAHQDLLAVANRTLNIAQTRFEARAAPESQVTRALLDVYELEVTREEHALQKAEATAELRSLLGGVDVPVDRFSESVENTAVVTEQLLQLDHLKGHPALAAAQLNVEAAEASLHRAKADRIPDLDISLAYGRNREADENYMEAGISLPLPLFNRNRGQIAAQKSEVALARNHALVVNNELDVQLTVAKQRYLKTQGQLTVVAQRILPAAERGLAQAQEGYRVGRVQFLELIDAQRTLATVRIRSLELNRDLALAEAQLMSLAGAGLYGE